jgi:hypothetical protein
MKTKPKKEVVTMDKLTANYEQLVEGKEIANNGKISFDKVIKKAVKQHGSK